MAKIAIALIDAARGPKDSTEVNERNCLLTETERTAVYNPNSLQYPIPPEMLRILAFLLATVTMAGACSEVFPEWTRGRDFSVVVTLNKLPLRSMRVILEPDDLKDKLQRIEGLTDENGFAIFHSVAPGRYYVEASRLGIEVGPGTVIVKTKGSSEKIQLEWPMRPEYQVLSVGGRFQHLIIEKKNPIDGVIHPHINPLANATLTLSRIDSEKTVEFTTTDLDGSFAFKTVDPGSYLLHIREEASTEAAFQIDDYLVIEVDPHASRGHLDLQLNWTSCGMIATEIR